MYNTKHVYGREKKKNVEVTRVRIIYVYERAGRGGGGHPVSCLVCFWVVAREANPLPFSDSCCHCVYVK